MADLGLSLTLSCIVKADVDRLAKEQKLPICLMGMTNAGSSGAVDSHTKSASFPTSGCVKAAVMSQIHSAANASLW